MTDLTGQALIRVMRQQMGDTEADRSFLSSLSEAEAAQLYALARSQDLVQFIGNAVGKNGTFGSEALKKAVLNDTVMLVRRFTLQEYELQSIRRVFDEAKIDYIPLKGAVLCALYPLPWLRSRGDLDILVREADVARAAGVLTEALGYEKAESGSHDVTFWSKSRVHIELHFSLIEENRIGTIEKPLLNVWEQAVPEEDGCAYTLPDALLYYYHTAHMAKHITNGGCGIRPFLDMWILRHRVTFDAAERERLLTQGGLLMFARTAEQLSEVWFGDAEPSELTQALESYILRGGVYGNLENLMAAKRAQYKSRFGVAIRQIFLPYSTMKWQFPILQKHPWLTPFYEMRRWGRIIAQRRVGNGIRRLKMNHALSDECTDGVTRLLELLELETR